MINEEYDYDNSVNLICSNDSHRGPGMVVRNLTKGLKKIDISVHEAIDSRAWKYTGYLQDCSRGFLKQCLEYNRPVLLGPNLFVLPTDAPYICQNFKDFVVPCQWVKDLYLKYDIMANNNMHIWPVGIDTDEWQHSKKQEQKSDVKCFIYHKNRSENDLALVEAICRKFNLKYEIIKYGNYHESQLKDLCSKAKTNNGFVILLTGTESQGIAYQNILSYGLPCYVFNCQRWSSEDGRVSVGATSVPYFNKECGEITNNVDLDNFKLFLEGVEQGKYNPRKYIVDNLTLTKQATEYMNLLKLSHGEVCK